MTDEIDAAQERQLLINETCIKGVTDLLKVEGSAECEGCGNTIDAARRVAYPAARRCIVCQRLREKRMP